MTILNATALALGVLIIVLMALSGLVSESL